MDVTANSFREFTGTLPDQTFVDDTGEPILLQHAGIAGEWTWIDDSPRGAFSISSPSGDGPLFVIGQSVD